MYRWQKPTKAYFVGKTLVYITLLLLCLVTVIPVIFVFTVSIRPEIDLTLYGQTFFPRNLTLDAYRVIFFAGDRIIRALLVTTGLTVAGVSASLFMNTFVAYPLSRTYLPYNRVMAFIIYFTVLFSGGLIPWFLMMRFLNLTNLTGIVINGSINAFNIIIFRNFFYQLPDSLEESAKLDGAKDFKIYLRIFLPLSKPVLATIGLFTAVGFWNEWFSVLILIPDNRFWTIQLLLRDMLQAGAALAFVGDGALFEGLRPNVTLQMATVVVATLPIMMVYPFAQKYFVHGMTMGAVKG